VSDNPVVHIVDDDEAVRDSTATLLVGAGYHCLAYPSATEFLASPAKTAPGCVLSDIRMPGMDGLALQAAMAAQGLNTPIVFMTGFADVPVAVRAMKNGAIDFVQKPCDPAALRAAIERAFALGRRERAAPLETAEAERRLAKLTAREGDVLRCLVAGDPNKVTAHKLGISARTVEVHRARVMEKLQVRSLAELVRLALAGGIGARSD
jgi:two-component system, LuxR family, response regulator FixJ